jgi:Flp pilus assembly protein TadD
VSSARINAVVLVATLVIGACVHAGTPDRVFTRDAWARVVEKKHLDPNVVRYPFETTPAMSVWVSDVLKRHASNSDLSKLDVIQMAMFDADFNFTYEDGTTLTAAEAFEQRRGNCMSFTALFVTLARAAGMDAFLLAVRRAPGVDKEGDLVVLNHHVVAGFRGPQKVTIYDFNITSSETFMQQFVIDDVMATAMYHNNLAGDAIREGNFEESVWHLEITTRLVPEWAPGWVNYGVARYRNGDTDGALACYERALEENPNNPSALTNMAFVYRELGRYRESDTALRAAAHKSTNPYTLIAIADSEMIRGNYDEASSYLRRARWGYRSEPEVWDAMSRLARLRGDNEKADRHAAQASKLRREAQLAEDE